ncbi:hypothetical protein A1Q2_06914 [Trichosporon asahii var. asahii CBS 8904]|uniref:Uncharacterized protein n=1 Tax=Trichosporon asahii var. asahii (strain CBS 8904) TaxID=1220162 RepID=K1VI47_TRIAC|nr:hypothetical protein A1Q2_06914 [Trichosporon asahii var. asahii CBS 8904]
MLPRRHTKPQAKSHHGLRDTQRDISDVHGREIQGQGLGPPHPSHGALCARRRHLAAGHEGRAIDPRSPRAGRVSPHGRRVRHAHCATKGSPRTQIADSAERLGVAERLQSYYAARDWAILQQGAAHAAESIVAGTRGLQCMRLDSETDAETAASRRDGRGDAVLAVRRHAPDHGWAELVTFSARDAAAVRAALRTMETRLPMEWHESCAEDAADCEDGCGAGKVCPEEEVEERGVHFVARLEWPTSLIEQERIDQGSDEGRIRLVGKEEGEHAEDKRKEIVRGMKLLMRGSDGLEINYQVEDGEITVTPPWVLERHSGGHPALV